VTSDHKLKIVSYAVVGCGGVQDSPGYQKNVIGLFKKEFRMFKPRFCYLFK